jgi:transporter family protein
MLTGWQAWSLLALFAWGLYGFLPKLAGQHLAPSSAMIYYALGVAGVAGVAAAVGGFQARAPAAGIFWSVLTGTCGALGGLAYFYALRDAPVSVAAPLTALYPVISLLLAFAVLRETVSPRQWFGVALALAAIWLIAEE